MSLGLYRLEEACAGEEVKNPNNPCGVSQPES
jgi:hypothetical protein